MGKIPDTRCCHWVINWSDWSRRKKNWCPITEILCCWVKLIHFHDHGVCIETLPLLFDSRDWYYSGRSMCFNLLVYLFFYWFWSLSNHVIDQRWIWHHIIFSCDQAALLMVQSVCLSVRLSVRHTFFYYVPIIVSSRNFQELLPMTEVTSMQKVKVRSKRSRSQRSQPT